MHTSARAALAALVSLAGCLAWSASALAAGVILFDSCQTLALPNTVYKLTADLESCGGSCLIIAADRITIDLQGHSITSSCGRTGRGISDSTTVPSTDLAVIKNGAIYGYDQGLRLDKAARASVLGITANDNTRGIVTHGANTLIKSCVARLNIQRGIDIYGDRTQVQQCNASENGANGIVSQSGRDMLITMNTANGNGDNGMFLTVDTTASFNTANNNGAVGIRVAAGSLLTRNTAMNNGTDYNIGCPSEATFNTSSGNPGSYVYTPSADGCHIVGNE